MNAYGVVAENNTGNGISASGGAVLVMGEGGSRNNGGNGFMLDQGSNVTFFGRQSWLQNKPFVVSANGQAGVLTSRSYVATWAGTAIRDNQGPGLRSYGSDLSFGAVCCDTPTVVEGNQGGAFLSEGSEVTLWGDTTFRGNGPYGVYAEAGSHATFYGPVNDPQDGTVGIRVDDHTEVGVGIVMNSEASFHGPNRVRDNGSAAVPTSAGIRVDGNSHAFFEKTSVGSTLVSGNVGPGLLIDLNSSVDARAATIRGNSQEGVRVRHGSVVDLGADSKIKPNAGGPLTCDGSSLVITDLVQATAACPNVETPSEPRPTRPEPLP